MDDFERLIGTPREMTSREWKRLKFSSNLQDRDRRHVAVILRAYWLDAQKALKEVDTFALHADPLCQSLNRIAQLKVSYYRERVFILDQTPKQVERRLNQLSAEIKALRSDLKQYAENLRARRKLTVRNSRFGALHSLFRDANAFWIKRTGKHLEPKSRDPQAWAFVSELAAIADPSAKPDSVRTYFNRFYELAIKVEGELDKEIWES